MVPLHACTSIASFNWLVSKEKQFSSFLLSSTWDVRQFTWDTFNSHQIKWHSAQPLNGNVADSLDKRTVYEYPWRQTLPHMCNVHYFWVFVFNWCEPVELVPMRVRDFFASAEYCDICFSLSTFAMTCHSLALFCLCHFHFTSFFSQSNITDLMLAIGKKAHLYK